MIHSTNMNYQKECTIIESIYGEVKLIKRSHESRPALVTLNFTNLEDCLDYVYKNHFQINIMYSGRRKKEGDYK